MIVECKNCGAPLDVEGGTAFVRCAYCGKNNRVRSMRTVHEHNPSGWVPPPTWTPPSTTQMPAVALPRNPKPPKQGGSPWLLGCAMLLPASLVVLMPLWYFGELEFLDFLPAITFDPDGAPEGPTIDLDVEPHPEPVHGEVGSWQETRGVAGAESCPGYVPRLPQVLLRTSAGAALTLETDSPEDNVLLLRLSDGTYVCDDDSGGDRNAAVSLVVPAGEHRVWVGSYSSGGSFPFTLDVNAQPIDAPADATGLAPDASPALGTLELTPGVSHSFDGSVSSFVDLSNVDGCRGFVSVAPQVVVNAPAAERTRFVTRSEGVDLVMAVRTPDGVLHCDDDSGEGLNPQLDLTLPSGRTAVWVGGFHAEGVGEYALDVGAPWGRHRVGLGVDPIAVPVLGTVNLDVPGWASTYPGATRADVELPDALGSQCRGFVGRAPDLTLLTTINRQLVLRVSSFGRSLYLVTRGPDGQFVCTEGQPVELSETFTPGATQVWVGQRRRWRSADFAIEVSE